MSKKTRQQKIIADLRRQLAAQKQANPSHPSPNPVQEQPVSSIPKTSTYEFKPQVAPIVIKAADIGQVSSSVVSSVDIAYVKRDLLKTVIFTVLAIGAQVVLWYLLGRR